MVGEEPYAEFKGDRRELSAADLALFARMKRPGRPLVVVLLSGRPLVLGSALADADALLAAWLPGSEGEGLSDVLLGDYKPTGKLPHSWPRTMAQIPITTATRTTTRSFPTDSA